MKVSRQIWLMVAFPETRVCLRPSKVVPLIVPNGLGVNRCVLLVEKDDDVHHLKVICS